MITNLPELRAMTCVDEVFCNVWLDSHSYRAREVNGGRQVVGDAHPDRESAIEAAARPHPAGYRVTHRLRVRFKAEPRS